MKKILLLFFILVGIYSNAAEVDSTWIRKNYTKKEVYITMRDGVKLFTSLYIPKSSKETHPFLLTRTPYSCSPYGEKNFSAYWNNYRKEYFKEGYIVVIQDVRGKYMSEGQFEDVRPFNAAKKGKEIDEASDTYDTVEWLLKNISGNNGNVGVFGISYPGFYSTMAAASSHPAIKAVSPQAPVTNWFIGDDFHHNGAFFQMDAFNFYSAVGWGFGAPHPKPTTEHTASIGFSVHDNYKYYLEQGSLKNLTKLTGDTIAFWSEMMEHPDYDDWWQARDARNATKNLNPAMLWVGGLFDAEDCWGAWNAYKGAEENNPGKEFNAIVEGPWSHGQWAANDGTHHGNIQFPTNTSLYFQQNFEIPFFNYFLKGKGDVSQIAEANIYITGADEWKSFTQWPPKNKVDKTMFLQADGKLTDTEPNLENSFSSYISDPAKPVPYEENVHLNRTREYMSNDQRFAARRPDVLVFQTDILKEDVTVTGNVIADIVTSISTTDADFVVKIIDVFPDDFSYEETSNDSENTYPMGAYQMLVRGEVFRGRYRNSFEKPAAFVPGQVDEVKFELPSIAHCFKTGHRIMVQVQSSWFPLVDRNPQQFVDIYHCNETDFVKSEIKIYHEKNKASKIILPVLN
ncbi:CocE/NonD family hydrolase [uncultured Draconibacterium sp.]|uniref:CocE/NonD family hydrolase n=1 Tax=uncultured Draconibacterium sp. TaxID=1573823 RepID=UPI003216DFA1